jgi:hypothetical protein
VPLGLAECSRGVDRQIRVEPFTDGDDGRESRTRSTTILADDHALLRKGNPEIRRVANRPVNRETQKNATHAEYFAYSCGGTIPTRARLDGFISLLKKTRPRPTGSLRSIAGTPPHKNPPGTLSKERLYHEANVRSLSVVGRCAPLQLTSDSQQKCWIVAPAS